MLLSFTSHGAGGGIKFCYLGSGFSPATDSNNSVTTLLLLQQRTTIIIIIWQTQVNWVITLMVDFKIKC